MCTTSIEFFNTQKSVKIIEVYVARNKVSEGESERCTDNGSGHKHEHKQTISFSNNCI